MSSQREDRLVWIDLEMTGLDPAKDTILEIAAIITDGRLEIVAEGPNLIIHREEEQLAQMIEIVQDMHEKNGLTELVRQSRVTHEEAELRLLSFLRQYCVERTAPLCGNTIWMDRMFLNRHMPSVDAWMHYRTVDVSSVKELARRWRPAALQKAPSKPESHRALDDIRASIEELRHYREEWLVAAEAPS